MGLEWQPAEPGACLVSTDCLWDPSLAELQLSAWVSAQLWTGSLLQGRTFSPLGHWSAKTQTGHGTAGSCGVTVQGKGWGGGRKAMTFPVLQLIPTLLPPKGFSTGG